MSYYLETHAKRAYASGPEAETAAARAIVDRVHKSQLQDRFTARDIHRKGWSRLETLLGAGGDVEAKQDGIGSKNHGLRSAFLLGDRIGVQSDGLRVDMTVRGDRSKPTGNPVDIVARATSHAASLAALR